MSEVILIGIDLAKRVFQLHGARSDGSVAYRKKLSRGQLLAFVAQQPKCLIAMKACATAHGWGREFEKLGRKVERGGDHGCLRDIPSAQSCWLACAQTVLAKNKSSV